MAPSRAECRASATSSSGVRAEASSSAGSRPKRRTSRLAVLFKCRISGAKVAVKPRCGPATILATASGREIAQFLGTSSPTTMSTTVDRATPSRVAVVDTAPGGRPTASRGPRRRAETDGSASMPITSEVTVMPSWAPDSWKVRRLAAFRALSAPRSPASTARSSSLRSTVVSENSAATNTAHASVRARARSSSRTSVTVPPPLPAP